MNENLKNAGFDYEELKQLSKHKKKQLINQNRNKKFNRIFK